MKGHEFCLRHAPYVVVFLKVTASLLPPSIRETFEQSSTREAIAIAQEFTNKTGYHAMLRLGQRRLVTVPCSKEQFESETVPHRLMLAMLRNKLGWHLRFKVHQFTHSLSSYVQRITRNSVFQPADRRDR